MAARIPEIRPIGDLARGARGILKGTRRRQEPVVITQPGRDEPGPPEAWASLQKRPRMHQFSK
jgi:hypothetical protein